MSSESIDVLWHDSINSLKQLLQEEETQQGGVKNVSINDAFHHFAKLYIRYTIILSNLTTCYDSSVQPQKRIDIKLTLEHVILRVINLRHLLAKWCPPNQDVLSKSGAQAPFPWEYLDLNKEMRELLIPPSKLESATPGFFREDQTDATRRRNTKVANLLHENVGSEEIATPFEEEETPEELLDGDEASVDTVQSEEALSEGDVTAATDDDYGDETNNRVGEISPELAAIKVQSVIRAHVSRKKTREHRIWLDDFVGLSTSCDRTELGHLESNLADIQHQRKQEQQYCKESYENDLHHIKDVVREEEGFAMQNKLRDERIQWITEHTISKNALPDSFEGFYAKDETPNDKENEDNQETKGKQKKNDAKGAKDNNKKSKDKKSADAIEVECPVLAAPLTLLDQLKGCINVYEERWQIRNVGPGRVQSQYHDTKMAKDLIIRGQVKSELTKDVEEKLLSNILKIKAMQEASTKKKSKKDGKGKGKKGKGKGKKAGKKEKPLPGAKLPGMKDMSVDEMLGVLVQNGLVSTPGEERTINDFIGGFENASPKMPDIDKQERWIPDDPSAFQLRKTIMEYCILPLGSETIKSNIQDDENIRSILFYGPEGSGKSLMVNIIASEIGALLINLSSATIGNSFGGKEGATKLIHMAFTVAKEMAYAPVIIHIDSCHEFFMAKSKKGSKSNVITDMQRFQKDLLIYKNLALKKEDRVIVIGCTKMPEIGDVKLLKWKGPSGKPEKQGFFDRSLYFSSGSNQADRAMLWKHFISEHQQPGLDCPTLALLSDGLTAGEISEAVNSTMKGRLNVSKPFAEKDFSTYISKDMTARQNDERFLTFTRQITGLDAAHKAASNAGDAKGSKNKKK